MKPIDDAAANGASREMLLYALSLALYWSAALLCSATNAVLVGQGAPAAPVVFFCGLLGALAFTGAAPRALTSRSGTRVAQAVSLGGPLLYGASTLLLGSDASPVAHVSILTGSGAMGASLGLTLACLGAYLSRYPKTKGAAIACGGFLAGAAAFLALSPFVFAFGVPMVSGLALLSALTLVIAGANPSFGHPERPGDLDAPTPRHPYPLPKGFWSLFASLLLYSIVYGIAISLTLDLGNGTAHASPMGLSLLAPGLILLVISLRFGGAVDFRRFQWFLFAPGILALLALPFGDGLVPLVCCGVIVMVFTFFDIASFVLLADLAHDCPPMLALKVFAWGRAANIGGMACGWGISCVVLGPGLDLKGNAIVLLAFFAVVILVMLMTFSGASASRTVQSPVRVEHISVDQADFDERCEVVARRCGLSARETELFKLFARGRSTAYIAETLCLSPSTVKTHTYRIYKKLDVHSRQDLIDLVEGEVERT